MFTWLRRFGAFHFYFVLFRSQPEDQSIADQYRRMNDVRISKLLTRPDVSNIHFPWKFYRQLLPGHLPQARVIVCCDTIFTDDAGNSYVLLNDRNDLGTAELVTRDLCL